MNPRMVNVVQRSCIEPGCTTQPVYNFEGEIRGLYCKDHAKEQMIDVVNPSCITPGCSTKPYYNNPGESRGLYCKGHADPQMVDVVNERCIAPGCSIQPSFNYVGERKGLYCSLHADPQMVDVKHKSCAAPGCPIRPCYNNLGESRGLYCKDHAEPQMVDVKHKSCAAPGCPKQPIYNFQGERGGVYCKDHAKPLMVNVIDPSCTSVGCSTIALHNYCGLKAAFCAKHKTDNMIYNPRRRCEVQRCRQVASHGPSSSPQRCEDHCQDDDMDFRVAPCKQCGRDQEYLDKDGLCRTYCSPTKLVELQRRWQKKREELVLKYLDDNLELPDFVTHLQDDKTLDRDCNLYRPDRVYDCGTHYTVVEVDEGQHKDKGRGCVLGCEGAELKRMHEIQVAAGLPCVFLRFNPDGYTVNGKVGTVNLQDRLVVLTKWLQQCFKMRPTKAVYETPVKYKYLFYDEYHASDRTFQEVNDEAIAELLASL
jgi:hypothetical protein